jgi:hypothetical protein
VKYLLNSVTEPFHARAIQTAQERMLERVTAVPEERAAGVRRLRLSRTQARNIVAGRFDTGSGSCRNPYDSPQPLTRGIDQVVFIGDRNAFDRAIIATPQSQERQVGFSL